MLPPLAGAIKCLWEFSASRFPVAPCDQTLQARKDLAARQCEMVVGTPNASDVVLLDQGKAGSIDISQLRATEAINALNVALQKYEGTVFLVTHDQDLMEEMGTRVWHFADGSIQGFKGSYEE